uniref:WAP domain-containing protein n=1 Tax=Cyprinus carpio TaxID=7962 RepID=A0A8C2FCH2_CYPCA
IKPTLEILNTCLCFVSCCILKCCSVMHRLKLTICVHTVKLGQCPKPKIQACAESCFHDGQCPATQKCCPTTCGHACSEP